MIQARRLKPNQATQDQCSLDTNINTELRPYTPTPGVPSTPSRDHTILPILPIPAAARAAARALRSHLRKAHLLRVAEELTARVS
jgi:hypothetical protein